MKIIYEGKEIELKDEANGFDLAKEVDAENKNEDVGYLVEEKIHDMRMPLPEGKEIKLIKKGSKEAFEMLNHSTSHLMAQALTHLYPGCKFGFGPAIDEGYYYDVDFGDAKVTEEDFPRIEAEMKKCAKENNPYVRSRTTNISKNSSTSTRMRCSPPIRMVTSLISAKAHTSHPPA